MSEKFSANHQKKSLLVNDGSKNASITGPSKPKSIGSSKNEGAALELDRQVEPVPGARKAVTVKYKKKRRIEDSGALDRARSPEFVDDLKSSDTKPSLSEVVGAGGSATESKALSAEELNQLVAIASSQLLGLTDASEQISPGLLSEAPVSGLGGLEILGIAAGVAAGAAVGAAVGGRSSSSSAPAPAPGLASNPISSLSTAEIANLGTTQFGALTTTELAALTTAQAGALTSAQLNTLSSAQLQAMETADLSALNTAAFSGLTTTELAN